MIFHDFIAQVVFVGGIIFVCGLLVLSLATAALRLRCSYTMLRISMALAGLILSAVLLRGLCIAAVLGGGGFGLKLIILTVSFCIPMLLGILAAIGPKRPFVNSIARKVIYLVSPAMVICLGAVNWFRAGEALKWTIAFVAVAGLFWEVLSRVAKNSQTEPT